MKEIFVPKGIYKRTPEAKRNISASKSGANHPMYGKRGLEASGCKGLTRIVAGYVRVLVTEDHPFFAMAFREGGSWYILEHRLVMAQSVGRPLASEEEVHHKNEVRDDNRLANLVLFATKAAHTAHHDRLGQWNRDQGYVK